MRLSLIDPTRRSLAVFSKLQHIHPKRFGIHVVLFPGHFHVLVTFKTGSDVHAIPPARSENVGQDHRRAPADLRLARRRFGIMALSGTRIFS